MRSLACRPIVLKAGHTQTQAGACIPTFQATQTGFERILRLASCQELQNLVVPGKGQGVLRESLVLA